MAFNLLLRKIIQFQTPIRRITGSRYPRFRYWRRHRAAMEVALRRLPHLFYITCLSINGGYEYGVLTNDNIANAIIYAADNGGDVINRVSVEVAFLLMKEAIRYAYGKSVLLIASAGNSGKSNSISYPGGYDNVIAVASSDSN